MKKRCNYRICFGSSLCLILFLLLNTGCFQGENSRVRKEVKEKYKAEEVRFNYVSEDEGQKKINIVEIIILNSPLLGSSNTDFENGQLIAKNFFHNLSIRKKEKYEGVRIIIINTKDSNKRIDFSKTFYYAKNTLQF